MSDLVLTIKCSNADKATVTIDKNASVLELKTKIAGELQVPSSQQRLIYKGRVLKDELTLESYGIEDGHTVHMVKGMGAAGGSSSSATPSVTTNPGTSATASTAPQQQSPPSFGFANPYMPAPGSMPFGMPRGFPGGMPRGFPGMMPPNMDQMQQQLMQNPELMQQMMNSPMMQSLLDNPEIMRNMMQQNPQLQAMMDANPQIRHILNDPSVRFFKNGY